MAEALLLERAVRATAWSRIIDVEGAALVSRSQALTVNPQGEGRGIGSCRAEHFIDHTVTHLWRLANTQSAKTRFAAASAAMANARLSSGDTAEPFEPRIAT